MGTEKAKQVVKDVVIGQPILPGQASGVMYPQPFSAQTGQLLGQSQLQEQYNP
jgi:hypothetical protein